jgi:hypothetical protein
MRRGRQSCSWFFAVYRSTKVETMGLEVRSFGIKEAVFLYILFTSPLKCQIATCFLVSSTYSCLLTNESRSRLISDGSCFALYHVIIYPRAFRCFNLLGNERSIMSPNYFVFRPYGGLTSSDDTGCCML